MKNKKTPKKAGITDNLGPQQIVVLDRGWVYVGKTTIGPKYIRIKNARCIRYWGTTKGLGELAQGGPTATTKLDVTGTVVAALRAVISIIPCQNEW